MDKEVIIQVSGGVVSAVNIPKGISVTLWDYDIEGVTQEELPEGEEILTDDNGDEYMEVPILD